MTWNREWNLITQHAKLLTNEQGTILKYTVKAIYRFLITYGELNDKKNLKSVTDNYFKKNNQPTL